MAEDPRTRVRRFVVEIMNQGNLDALGEFVADEVVSHGAQGDTIGYEGIEAAIVQMQEAFPDLSFVIDDLLVDGERVALRGHWSGTHKALFAGVRPTGKHVRVPTIEMYRLSGDKIVEHWGLFDRLGLLQQLGALPSPQSN
jgi:steroid delta-isomerase-like uncharacterized protein